MTLVKVKSQAKLDRQILEDYFNKTYFNLKKLCYKKKKKYRMVVLHGFCQNDVRLREESTFDNSGSSIKKKT